MQFTSVRAAVYDAVPGVKVVGKPQYGCGGTYTVVARKSTGEQKQIWTGPQSTLSPWNIDCEPTMKLIVDSVVEFFK